MGKTSTKYRGASIYTYIAANGSPKQINSVLTNFGIPAAKSPQEAASKMKAVVRKNGQDALDEIAKLHPDRSLVLNACGYENCSGCKYKNAEGEDAEKSELGGKLKGFVKDNQTLVISVVAIIAIIAVAKSN